MSVPLAPAWELAAATASAAAGFFCLSAAFLLWRQARKAPPRALVILALGASAVMLLAAIPGVLDPRLAWVGGSVRNLCWLAVIRALFAGDGRHASLTPVRPMLLALAMVELLQVPLVMLTEWFANPPAYAMIMQLGALFRMLFAIGVLVLVHNLYAGASPQQRPQLRFMAGALVLAWGCELNLAMIEYIGGSLASAMIVLRGLVWSIVAVLVYRDGCARDERSFSPSRTVAFQSLSLLVIAFYLLAIFTVDGAAKRFDFDMGLIGQLLAIALTLVSAALLASSSLRAWLRETLVQHLFRHRYDYREEWLRFSRTTGGGELAPPLEQRAVQALAEIVDSPAGLLLTPGEAGRFELTARWQWPTADVPAEALDAYAAYALGCANAVIPLDDARAGRVLAVDARQIPAWLLVENRAWALVPLVLENCIVAVVVLARPAYGRALDWEDFDLLRIVGQQLAAHLLEQTAQKALMEATRFEDFNRRIAFVMHDIKNLASQLGLLVANAERHMENPAFRTDMLVTMRNCSSRLEALLGRLSRYGGTEVGPVSSVRSGQFVRDLADRMFTVRRIRVGDGGGEEMAANGEALEQVLRHLLQNALDASCEDGKVSVSFPVTADMAGIEIADNGCGMSAEFVRDSLFKPFVSTKANGFGIGAFEARELVKAMNGRLEVTSIEGAGSRFTVWLPRAGAEDEGVGGRQVA